MGCHQEHSEKGIQFGEGEGMRNFNAGKRALECKSAGNVPRKIKGAGGGDRTIRIGIAAYEYRMRRNVRRNEAVIGWERFGLGRDHGHRGILCLCVVHVKCVQDSIAVNGAAYQRVNELHTLVE